MRTTRTGYVAAMMAGIAIVGAATAGVSLIESSHAAAATSAAAEASVPATVGTLDTLSSGPPAGSTTGPPAAPDPAVAGGSTVADASPSPTPSLPATPSSTPAVVSTPDAAATTGRATTPAPSRTTSRTTSPERPAPARSSSTPAPVPSSTATPVAAAKFRDGQYSATGSYNSPGGIEKLGVTVTLASDKVVKSDLDLLGGAGLSHSFQTAFASEYAAQVIGKSIDSISLGAVSGSSLTALGFNDALAQIEAQAKKP